jgi:hypothetical protein
LLVVGGVVGWRPPAAGEDEEVGEGVGVACAAPVVPFDWLTVESSVTPLAPLAATVDWPE